MHVTFYRCFDRLLGSWIINEFLKFISWMLITPSFKKSLIVKQFQGQEWLNRFYTVKRQTILLDKGRPLGSERVKNSRNFLTNQSKLKTKPIVTFLNMAWKSFFLKPCCLTQVFPRFASVTHPLTLSLIGSLLFFHPIGSKTQVKPKPIVTRSRTTHTRFSAPRVSCKFDWLIGLPVSFWLACDITLIGRSLATLMKTAQTLETYLSLEKCSERFTSEIFLFILFLPVSSLISYSPVS